MADNTQRMNNKVLQVIVSQALADELESHAYKLGQSISSYCREILANSIGYDLSLDTEARKANERRGRPRKYSSEQQRKDAKNERERANRANVRQILDDYRHQLHIATAGQLRESLEKKGINPDE